MATNKTPKIAQKFSSNVSPLLLRGHRKKSTEKRPHLWRRNDFFATTPSVRQPLFETSDDFGLDAYHSFRNHYIFNSKTIFYVTVTVIFGK